MASSLPPSGIIRDRRPEALGDLRHLPDEVLCSTFASLSCRDLGRLACVSSVMYILCNEEPLWMSICLNSAKGQLQYKGSWKKTTLAQEHLLEKCEKPCQKPLQFDGFSSLFLYRRMYRCYTFLGGFSFDNGNVDRKKDLSLEEFYHEYDAQKPVLLGGLADTWPARNAWTVDQLLLKYGETAFKISQRSARKITMKFKDYVSYMEIQHDEDPLYIFDEKFGEVAPTLLNDYNVPHLFQEDLFDVLDTDQRPSYRWLIVGPERSGASWHVDPALTSAWNTLLCGRKRWALYPPGRVPLGVTVHVNEEDGDVNIETPSSLQWWLDFYPLLADEDKPIECTQLPGETIYVPSGWWHCILNLETTIAVTQNYVNSNNFEFVCLDMAPGYCHKGVCRAGLLALDEDSFEMVKKNTLAVENGLSNPNVTRKEKRMKISKSWKDCYENSTSDTLKCQNLLAEGFCYDINFLSMFLDGGRDHYNSIWSSSNCIGQREMREWLCKLWTERPHKREMIWKGACLALNASRWAKPVAGICSFHNLPSPTDDERLPVGTGSNPVYLIADHVIKIFVEGGLEASLHGLGTELEFYRLLAKVSSPLKDHIPDFLASGFVILDNRAVKVESWDGREVPQLLSGCKPTLQIFKGNGFPFGLWSKKQYDYRTAGLLKYNSVNSDGCSKIWPYIITKRCKGKIFAQLRDKLSWEDIQTLASFLGEQLRSLHLLPCPDFHDFKPSDQNSEIPVGYNLKHATADKVSIPREWDIFIRTLNKKKKSISSHLTKWGDPIPSYLIEKVADYLPDDFVKLFYMCEVENGFSEVCKPCTWIHSDIMVDNIHMEPHCVGPSLTGAASEVDLMDIGSINDVKGSAEGNSWQPSHILDFSNMSIGDPLCDLIPIHLDVFRGDTRLLKQLLGNYNLPLLKRMSSNALLESGNKFGRLSYHAMCYCIIHEDDILGAIFSIWRELRSAKTWEEVEAAVWGELNNYEGPE